jgi:hypothetical protein
VPTTKQAPDRGSSARLFLVAGIIAMLILAVLSGIDLWQDGVISDQLQDMLKTTLPLVILAAFVQSREAKS